MATIPNWLLGRHLTSVTLTGQSVDASGNMSAGTAQPMTTLIENIEFGVDPALVQVNAVNDTVANYMLPLDDYTITITEIIRANATPVLLLFAANYAVGYFVFTRGSNTFAMYCIRGAFADGVKDPGKNTVSLTLRPVGIGPAIA